MKLILLFLHQQSLYHRFTTQGTLTYIQTTFLQ